MKLSFLEFLRQSLQGEESVHPLERQMARRWVKERLKKIYPELRNNPEALNRAYQELGIEQHEGAGRGASTVYEITLPTSETRF